MSSIASIKNLPVPAVQRRPAADAQAEQAVDPVRPVSAIAKILRPRDDAKAKQPELQPDKGKGGRRQAVRTDVTVVHGEEVVMPRSGQPSVQFMVQLLDQDSAATRARRHSAGPIDLAKHRDGPALGSEIYRRAGGEPRAFGSEAAIFRIAV